MSIQYKILTFQFIKYLRWITGKFIDCTNISVNFLSLSHFADKIETLEFEINLNSTVPWKKSPFSLKTDSEITKPLSLDAFAMFLIRGEMMAFLPNIQNVKNV